MSEVIIIKNPRLLSKPEQWMLRCWKEGEQAHENGESSLNNPYEFRSKAWKDWDDGYQSKYNSPNNDH